MLKHGHAILVLGLLLVSVGTAQAQWATNLTNYMCRDFIRNNSWPHPFVEADRDAVTLPEAAMVANGWKRQTLLCDGHFNDDSTKLNHAGLDQVRWILTKVPPQHRVIYVERGMTPTVTATRVAAIQRVARGLLPPGHMAEIMETNMSGEGFPADRADLINRKVISSMPDPKLPPMQDASGGAGGGASGGGG